MLINGYFKNKDDSLSMLNLTDQSNPNYWVYGLFSKNKKNIINEMRLNGFYASGVHMNNNNYSVFGNLVDLNGVNKFMNDFVAIPSGWWVEEIL